MDFTTSISSVKTMNAPWDRTMGRKPFCQALALWRRRKAKVTLIPLKRRMFPVTDSEYPRLSMAYWGKTVRTRE